MQTVFGPKVVAHRSRFAEQSAVHRPSRGPLWAHVRPDAHGAVVEQRAPTFPGAPFVPPPELPELVEPPELLDPPELLGLPELPEPPEQAPTPIAKKSGARNVSLFDLDKLPIIDNRRTKPCDGDHWS
jgi:hypothetical protein